MLFIKKIIYRAFALFGLDVKFRKNTSLDTYHHNHAMIDGLNKLKKAGLGFSTIVDVGAAQGAWSLSAAELWPKANYLLFEPLDERQAELRSIASKHSNFFIAPYAAGTTDGETSFYISEDLDGSGVASSGSKGTLRKVYIRSVQDEVEKNNLTGPYLIKLDTHGYELPIIEGSKKLLDNTSAFIIECYGFQIADGSLLFWEMCRHMETLGFRLYNIVDVMNREKDGAFWQCDAFFLRKDHPVFANNRYA